MLNECGTNNWPFVCCRLIHQTISLSGLTLVSQHRGVFKMYELLSFIHFERLEGFLM